jgi:hypothetical protein
VKAGFTEKLRVFACLLWSLGLAVLAFDFLSVPLFDWRVSVCYAFFSFSALATIWAEKREFGTRAALYRAHDVIIFGPWKFLLLYFLWISIFSPFSGHPLASMVYAANGWLSLAAIGITAQLIFCERTISGAVLHPGRLRVAFLSYCSTVGLLLLNVLGRLALPGAGLPMLVNETANLFLYFTLGLPYLLWDFLKPGRRLVPRWLSGGTIIMGAVATLLLGRGFYLLTTLACLLAYFGWVLFKRIRMRPALLLAALAAGWALAVGLGLLLWLEQGGLRGTLEGERLAMAERMRGNFTMALSALRQSRGLGLGLGATNLRGVWARVLAEAGIIGFVFYLGFFFNVLADLIRVRRSSRIVVSNVSFISVGIFLLLVSHHVENPYGAYVWVWYALWALFASTARKKRLA